MVLEDESDPELSHIGDSQMPSVWTLLTVSDTAHLPFDSGSPPCVSRLVAPPPDAAFRLPATGGVTLFFSAMDGVFPLSEGPLLRSAGNGCALNAAPLCVDKDAPSSEKRRPCAKSQSRGN